MEEMRAGKRKSVSGQEIEWGRDYERTMIPDGARFPRKGDVYESLGDQTVGYYTAWAAPYTGSGEGTLFKGERIWIDSEPGGEKPVGSYALPVEYAKLEERMVPGPVRESPKYGGFQLYFGTVELNANFKLVGTGFRGGWASSLRGRGDRGHGLPPGHPHPSTTGGNLMKRLEKYADYAYALLRIMTGFMFAFHGMQKIFGVLSDFQPPVMSQLWIGGVIEIAGGLMVMLGWQSRLAAFICSGEMAVAYFQYHWKFQMGREFFPTINKGELAVLYCFVFLYIACRGGVSWSLDKAS